MALHKEILYIAFCIFLFHQGVLSQNPVPGDAAWTGRLNFQTNSTKGVQFAFIDQSMQNMEWKNLGTSFTVELWLKSDSFASDPLGRWNDNFTAAFGETRFLPIVTRHPGMGLTNQWSHFLLQLSRTPQGIAVVVWSGCGCANPPAIMQGRQVGLENCGYGYLLASDSPKVIGGTPFYLKPETWTHVAFSFDGDNTDMSKTRTASLYINGNLLLTNAWADPDNVGRAYNKSVCVDKPMQWFRDIGLMSSIALGHLDNQDFNAGRVINNANPDFNVYGANATLDELRIWRTVRTAAQIQNNFDVALTGKDLQDPTLVAYYKFNEGPTNNQTAKFNDSVKPLNAPSGYVVTIENTTAQGFNFWSSSYNVNRSALIINTKTWAAGTLPSTPRAVTTTLTLPSFSIVPLTTLPNGTAPVLAPAFAPYSLTIAGFSPLLTGAVMANQARVTVASTGAALSQNQTLTPGEKLNVVLFCSDAQCSNLAGSTSLTSFPWRNFFINYHAGDANVTAKLFINVFPDCDGSYDACGVCNGDNRTCQCVVYHEFKNIRMSYVLLTFMVDFLIDKVNTTTQILDETLDKINTRISSNTPIPAANVQTQQLMSFYNGCLSNYCQSVTRFLRILTSIPPPPPFVQ